MWKWAGVASVLALLAVLWLWREPRTPRASGPRPTELPVAPPAPQPVAPQADDAPPARGVVVDEDGRPIKGAVVQWRKELNDAEAPATRTADDGTFAFDSGLPSEGIYAVEAAGYAGRMAEAGTDRIVLSRGTLRVRARVVDEDQRPIEGATGEVFLDDGYGRGVSDALGALEIRGLFAYAEEPGGLLVRAKGHVPEAVQLGSLQEDTDAGTVVLSRGGIVTGVVRDERSGSPVPGARVGYEARWTAVAAAGADGSFRLEAVPLDAIWLYAYADGYLPSRTGWSPVDLWDRKIFPEEKREIVRDVLVVQSATVQGTVLDADGAAAANASVQLREKEESPREVVPGIVSRVATDAKGRFAVAGFYPGSALTIAAASEHGLAEAQARAGEGTVVLRLEPTRRVVGRVVNGRGEPVLGAQLTIEAPDAGARPPDWDGSRSDEDGRFEFSHVRPGAWSLVVEAKGLVTVTTTISVAAGRGEVDLGDIALGSGSFVGGLVIDEGGAPIEGVGVRVWGQGSAATDADGRFRIEGLEDGEVEVEAWMRGRRRVRVAAASGSADLRLVLPELLKALGRVLGGEAPLPDARVHATGGNAGDVAEDGTFTVTELEPDQPFQLTISHPLWKTLSCEAKPWEGVRDFRLVEGRFFEGTVVDERGRPLAGMSVRVSTEGHDDGRTVESGADGRWRVAGLEDGRVVVHLWGGPGYAHEQPVTIAPGVASCRLVAQKGYEIRGVVRRKDKSLVEAAAVTVYREDGSEVSAGFTWYGGHARFSTTELAPGKYRLVVNGHLMGQGGTHKEDYGEATLEVTVPCPDVEVVLPK